MLLEMPLLVKEGAQSITWEWICSDPLWNTVSVSYWGAEGSLSPLHVVHDPGACDAQSLMGRFPNPFILFLCSISCELKFTHKAGFRHLLKELLKIGWKPFATMLYPSVTVWLEGSGSLQEQIQCCLRIIAQMALIPHTASVPLEGGVLWHLKMKWNKLKVSVREGMKMLRVNYIECSGSFPWPWELPWKDNYLTTVCHDRPDHSCRYNRKQNQVFLPDLK